MSKPATILRRFVPRRLVSATRLLVVFQRQLGHLRTKDGLIVNGAGEHIPWLTYPAIEYLNGLDLSGLDVFEFGSGASTLYWAARAKSVAGVELDAVWHGRISKRLPANATLRLETDGGAYPLAVAAGTYDIIVVDGAERRRCAEAAVRALRPGGMIILDNADWYPATSAMLAEHYIEVRFSGFSPLNAFTSTTAMFLDRHFAIPMLSYGRRPPVGGRAVMALDD